MGSFLQSPLGPLIGDQSETQKAKRGHGCPKIHARYVNYVADFKPEKHLSSFRWKYIFIFCKLNHYFTLDKPSVSWGSFCNDLHWKREHLQIICSKKKNILFLSK